MDENGNVEYGRIVDVRPIRFDALTWAWAKKQKNLSAAIRKLIFDEVYAVKIGRPWPKRGTVLQPRAAPKIEIADEPENVIRPEKTRVSKDFSLFDDFVKGGDEAAPKPPQPKETNAPQQ